MSKLFVEVHDGGDVTVEDCFGGSGLYYSSHFGIQVYADKMRRTEIWNACDEIADAAKELDELLRNEGGDD